jgi:hypothetical protein
MNYKRLEKAVESWYSKPNSEFPESAIYALFIDAGLTDEWDTSSVIDEIGHHQFTLRKGRICYTFTPTENNKRLISSVVSFRGSCDRLLEGRHMLLEEQHKLRLERNELKHQSDKQLFFCLALMYPYCLWGAYIIGDLLFNY